MNETVRLIKMSIQNITKSVKTITAQQNPSENNNSNNNNPQVEGLLKYPSIPGGH